jgi:pimeloyl-ACP methyl ester carboxylesterase
MKHFSLIFVFCLLINNLFSQSNNEIASKIGYSYFSIKDTFELSTTDSIRFIISNIKDNKPILLFIQGSGNASLIEKDGGNSKCFFNSLISDNLINDYRIVLISKPGIPLSLNYNSNDNNINSKFRGDYLIFTQNNFLDYYVSSAKQVIDYLSIKIATKSHVYVVGHSQGYQIVAKLAAKYPDKIDKVVCMSSNPFGQLHTQSILNIRQNELLGRIDPNQAQFKIDSIYSNLRLLKRWSKLPEPDKPDENYSYFRTDYSFNCEMAVDNLVKIKCPIMVVYGTADLASAYNDLLPFFFSRSNNDNLTMKSYVGYDHNYFYREYSKDGRMIKTEFNWPIVFSDIVKWLKIE